MADSRAILRRLDLTVPKPLARRVQAWSASDAPVPPALSASVVLLREEPGLQVYLMHRHARMPFAASMVVFPGGRVDPVDEEASSPVRACAVRETLEETGVRLQEEGLLPWAHWVTPEAEPRRFDTEFFVAALPSGETARDISGETDHADWAAPEDALSALRRGDLAMMPPTLSILMELCEAGSLASVIASARDRLVHRVLPEVVFSAGQWAFRYPEAAG